MTWQKATHLPIIGFHYLFAVIKKNCWRTFLKWQLQTQVFAHRFIYFLQKKHNEFWHMVSFRDHSIDNNGKAANYLTTRCVELFSLKLLCILFFRSHWCCKLINWQKCKLTGWPPSLCIFDEPAERYGEQRCSG